MLIEDDITFTFSLNLTVDNFIFYSLFFIIFFHYHLFPLYHFHLHPFPPPTITTLLSVSMSPFLTVFFQYHLSSLYFLLPPPFPLQSPPYCCPCPWGLCNSMVGPGEHCAKWNEPVRESQVPYDFTYMWNLMNELNYKPNTKRLLDRK